MKIYLGSHTIKSKWVVNFEMTKVKTFPCITFYFINGHTVDLMFYSHAIKVWINDELRNRLKNKDKEFDIDAFLIEKHLQNAYLGDGRMQYQAPTK